MERDALLSGMVHPGDRKPAPGSLALVQHSSTRSTASTGPTCSTTSAGLGEWLRRRGLLEPGAAVGRRATSRPRASCARRCASLLLANNGEPRRPGRPRRARGGGRARRAARRRSRPTAPELVPAAAGVDGALGRVVAAAFAAMLDGSWPRLKACPRDVCGWAFYDRSSNASATWCSMAVCGGRVKAGAYYRRRRAAGH